MLFTKNLKQKKLSKKLSDKIIKFFHIHEFIDKQTYHLNLSIIYRMKSRKIFTKVKKKKNLIL